MKFFIVFSLYLAVITKAELILSGALDGPLFGGNPKFVEFFATTNIADLSIYTMAIGYNGASMGTAVYTFPSDSVAQGTYIYLAATANNGEAGFLSYFNCTPQYLTSASLGNGDDAFLLRKNGVAIDTIGKVGVDGTGQAWEYLDGWIKRKNVSTASTPTVTFNQAEWTVSGKNALDGCATNTLCDSIYDFKGCETNVGTDPDITLISAVQGSGASTPLNGVVVTIQGIVVGDFQDGDSDTKRNLAGFFVQEEDVDADNNPLTSEGVFVYDPTLLTDVSVGDEVIVVGTAGEAFGSTQIGDVSRITVVSSGNPLPTAATITLPLAASNGGNSDLEPFEGMLVTVSNKLVITEMFQLDRFNEIKLATERFYQYTQQSVPNTQGYADYLDLVARSTITYDDGLATQNNDIRLLDGFQNWPVTPIRMGDSVTSLTGVLYYSFSLYRLISIADGSVSFVSENPRPAAPILNGDLKIVTLNVLNFFTTLDIGTAKTSNGNDPRGADSQTEFDRQLEKLLTCLLEMDADIFALIEIENDFLPGSPGNAIKFLTDALNGVTASRTYDWVDPGQQYVDSSDAISNGFIHKTNIMVDGVAILNDAVVESLNSTLLNQDSSGTLFDGPNTNRASLAATFTIIGSANCITIANNHFKSKGGTGTGADADQNDGAASFNNRRLLAAKALDQWLDTDPTGAACKNIAIVGDLNSYAKEDPVRYLTDTTFNPNAKFREIFVNPEVQYSYVFDGMIGTLDYVFVNAVLAPLVVDAKKWHINEDEPDALDYNLDFGRLATYFDGSNAVRNSDHSPVLLGIDFTP
ncbi:uncharacterized protein FisN_18Lh256 [Fistulifera solaris]|uniref:LTD domain-containing protein n=1 Tax=Fistulifera solaris TaxID=1519565 RepID=A0A1Z5JUA8_FISSO|nr:uncharacterized protein FisN_18Lh256 [Fistulifera solaris]|eukprot:GAX17600.1 uncharacterized protein FisN_18Lh256 [Fistulifera solaris]